MKGFFKNMFTGLGSSLLGIVIFLVIMALVWISEIALFFALPYYAFPDNGNVALVFLFVFMGANIFAGGYYITKVFVPSDTSFVFSSSDLTTGLALTLVFSLIKYTLRYLIYLAVGLIAIPFVIAKKLVPIVLYKILRREPKPEDYPGEIEEPISVGLTEE